MVASAAVQETSHTYNWFFLFYRFVVGVLFAQLTVGILIATFGEASRLDTSATGEVLSELESELEVLSHEEQLAFVKELGVPAQFSLDTASAATGDLIPVVKPAPSSLMRMATNAILPIFASLTLILALQATVWYLWVDMAEKSIEAPLNQLLLTRSLRANHVLNTTLQPVSLAQELLCKCAPLCAVRRVTSLV